MVDLDALQKMYDQRMNHSGSIVWREEITAQFPALVAHIKSIEAQLGEARGLRAAYAALDADENEETEQAFIDALDSFDLAIARPESTPPAEPVFAIEQLTDRDLPPIQRVIGNMWQEYYRVAHRELVVANRAVQRLSQRCKNLRFTLHNLTITLGRNERERFEHWAEYGGLDLERDEKFQYCLSATNLAWECWQARARLDGTQNAAAPLSPPSEKIK